MHFLFFRHQFVLWKWTSFSNDWSFVGIKFFLWVLNLIIRRFWKTRKKCTFSMIKHFQSLVNQNLKVFQWVICSEKFQKVLKDNFKVLIKFLRKCQQFLINTCLKKNILTVEGFGVCLGPMCLHAAVKFCHSNRNKILS